MTLTLSHILASAGLEPLNTLVIRHAYVREHEDGSAPIHADSSDDDVLAYTREQSSNTRTFPKNPAPVWVVFLPEGGDRARLWSVLTNHGEVSDDGTLRTFELTSSNILEDLRNRLVIGWRSPRTWRLGGLEPQPPTPLSRSPTLSRFPFPASTR